jgi:phenylpropionate dioxygenase-like ring-hydroxylating dioxygenase large terminal subunit
MIPLIEPQDYSSHATFQAERERVFMANWIFACTVQELPNHEDYRTIEASGVSVVLQNFHGEIKAFNNVCTHRFARIHSEASGNRQLKCPYHGWIYNSEGLPYAIPRKPLIAEITPSTLCNYRLSRWHVHIVGPLIFIRKERVGEALDDSDFDRQLGDYVQPLMDFSAACGEMVENSDYVVKANWKLVVENTLEGYHVDCVHPNTIRKLGMTGLSKSTAVRGSSEEASAPAAQKGSAFTFSNRNSAVFSSLSSEVSNRMDRTYRFLADRPLRLDGYRHYFLFPNFVFASTRGESFSLQRILPIDETSTQLTSYLFATNGLGELSRMEAALRKQFYASAAEFVRAIFAEDCAICEEVQRGVRFAEGRGVLSDEEERICAFHEAYGDAMRETPPSLKSTFTDKCQLRCSNHH